MRAVKAKAIRRRIYGDRSHRVRDYRIGPDGSRWSAGLRRRYLLAKRGA